MTESKIKACFTALSIAVVVLAVMLFISVVALQNQIKLERQDRVNTECGEELALLSAQGKYVPARWDDDAPGVCKEYMAR